VADERKRESEKERERGCARVTERTAHSESKDELRLVWGGHD